MPGGAREIARLPRRARATREQIMSKKTWVRELTAAEMRHLAGMHRGLAKYQFDCEQMQKEQARKPRPYETFYGGPLDGKPKTCENWLARADFYRKKAQAFVARANYFSVTGEDC